MSAEQDLREAYIEYGCAISSLWAIRPDKIDPMLVSQVHWHVDRANHLADQAGDALGFFWTPAVFRIGPGALIASEQVENPHVIALLRSMRERLAKELATRGVTVPDDLPSEGEMGSVVGAKYRQLTAVQLMWVAVFLSACVLGVYFVQ